KLAACQRSGNGDRLNKPGAEKRVSASGADLSGSLAAPRRLKPPPPEAEISMDTNTVPSASIQAIPNIRSRSKWAARIADAWQKQITSIFETGSLLESAKAELRHGEFVNMIKVDLPFGRSTVNKLMKIAACDQLRNAEHAPHLPAHWMTLYDLTLLTE